MPIYSLTYFTNVLGFFKNEKFKKFINVIVIGLLIFMSGTRYYMGGSDVYVYESVYDSVPSVINVLKFIFTGVNNGVNDNYEHGFILICAIIKSLNFSFFGFTLIFALLFYVLLYHGLKEFVVNWAPFWALFMYKLMFYNTFISIRQGFTIAIFCCSLKYIRDKKWIQYFILCFVAFYIHRGAIIMFLIYFVQFIPATKKTIGWISAIFLPTWFIRNQVNLGGLIEKIISIIGFENKSEGWAEATEPISIIHTLECYIFVVLIMIFYDKIVTCSKEKEAHLALQIFLVTIPIFTLLSNWIVMTREKDYFVLMYGVIFGYIIENGTTTPSYEIETIKRKWNISSENAGNINAKILSLVLIVACFIGMVRYVSAFDGGALSNFESFVTKGVSIFN